MTAYAALCELQARTSWYSPKANSLVPRHHRTSAQGVGVVILPEQVGLCDELHRRRTPCAH